MLYQRTKPDTQSQFDYILRTWVRHYNVERPHRGRDIGSNVLHVGFRPVRDGPIRRKRQLGGIVTSYKVHAILTESPRKRAARTRAETPALLKGLLYGPDGAAFSPTHTRKGGRLYRYYVSQTVLKHGAGSCPIGRVPAGEIEAAVIDQLRAVFRQPEIVAGTWRAARVQDDNVSEADARTALQQLDPLWDELFPAEQARIVALLVERVDIGTDGLDVRLRIDGLGGLVQKMQAGGVERAA